MALRFLLFVLLGSRVSLTAIGQNLVGAAHPELGGADSFVLAAQVPRTLNLRLRWGLP